MPIIATVSELIVREIVDRLESYEESNDTIFTVYREISPPDKTTPTDYQVVVRATSPTRLQTLDRIGNPNVIAYQLTVECLGQVVVTETDTEATEGHAAEIAAKIVKAVTTGASWYTMDGNAINTVVGDVSIEGSNAAFIGRVSFVVTYRHPETDPFTAAG
jgi:hypothetical protein